jgi:membrane protein YqaA with SNARE-associated domain
MSWVEGLRGLGLLGVFLASFLGHLSIVMKDVIFIPIFLYASNFWNPLLMGLVGGIGGGLGELGAYLIGRGMGKLSVNARKKMEIPKWARKLGLLSVLVCSLTPLPDAPVLILIGSARFPILAVLALEILGKVFLYTTLATAGGILYSSLNAILPTPWDSVLTIIAFIGVSVIATSKRATTFILRLAQRAINKIPGLRKRKTCGQCIFFTNSNHKLCEKLNLDHGFFPAHIRLRLGYGICVSKAKMVRRGAVTCSDYQNSLA